MRLDFGTANTGTAPTRQVTIGRPTKSIVKYGDDPDKLAQYLNNERCVPCIKALDAFINVAAGDPIPSVSIFAASLTTIIT